MISHHSRLEKSWSWDHLGVILGSSWDGFRTKCWSVLLIWFHFVGTCLGHVYAHFWNTFRKMVSNKLRSQKRMKLCQITFLLKIKLLMRSRGRSGDFVSWLVREVLLNYVRQLYVWKPSFSNRIGNKHKMFLDLPGVFSTQRVKAVIWFVCEIFVYPGERTRVRRLCVWRFHRIS